MKKVKITVLKTTLDEELAAEYGAEGLGPCPMLREGQVFYADYAKPDGLCDEAWKAIYQYVFALAHGAGEGLFYYGDWIRRPGVAICSCNDGLRPVIFSRIACKVVDQMEIGSFLLFVGQATEAEVLGDGRVLTLQAYTDRGKATPPTATVYRTVEINGYRCTVCGYVYEGESLPPDFRCPLCHAPAEKFVKIEK